MKREIKICFLYALLYSLPYLFFVLLLLFFSLPVQAADASTYGTRIFRATYNNRLQICEYWSTNATDLRYLVFDYGVNNRIFVMYTVNNLPDFTATYREGHVDVDGDGSEKFYTPTLISSSSFSSVQLSDGTIIYWAYGGVGTYTTDNGWSIEGYCPIYSSASDYPDLGQKKYSKAFFEHLILIGDLIPSNMPSIDNPDFVDSAYAFTGFTANNKMTATWTGTTERSYLKDEDVEEYVRVSYGFAAKDAPDSIKQVDNDSTEYSTAAKSLTVKVSDLVPDDDSWFLRYVQVIPCYRQAGLGVWGDFYHGVACKVYFNQDGSIDKIVRDFPQGSGDYSYKHIFSSDKYSNEIPAPELSAISHNGFTLLNNSNNDYYVDIILESNLYGVKMEKNAGTWLPVVDTDWIYNSHYYNFADTSQIAINNDVIYIPNLFSVNPESDLIDDFKKWSFEYSSYSSLPSMSFLKRSTAARTRYVDQFLFKDNSKYSDSEQLRFSHMAESVFYVRYYNKSMVYGPWVRYKFRDGYVAQVIDGTLGGAYIDVGQVDTDDSGNVRVDENGNPIVSDNVSGRQDYDTGESDFSDGSFSLDLSDVTKFFDYLKKIFESVTGALSSFGSVVAACFGFLPGELVNALIFGICVMMFIGIIKAVKG